MWPASNQSKKSLFLALEFHYYRFYKVAANETVLWFQVGSIRSHFCFSTDLLYDYDRVTTMQLFMFGHLLLNCKQ